MKIFSNIGSIILLLTCCTHALAFVAVPGKQRVLALPTSPIVGIKSPLESRDATTSSSLPLSLGIATPEVLSTALESLASATTAGSLGVLALSGVTWAVVLPLTIYKKLYGISVAYGFSVGAAGWFLLKSFKGVESSSVAALLAKACIFYGVRLGYYLLVRDFSRKQASTIDNGSLGSRVAFSYSLSLFYAMLMTPVMYSMRAATETLAAPWMATVSKVGLGMAWFGALLEALADYQKFFVKQRNTDREGIFVGPTSGAYRLSRHPNYLGEILFWTGVLVSGAPTFGFKPMAWIPSVLGWYGIIAIMLKACSGLEKRQQEKYGGQEDYEIWKREVRFPLFPFVQS